MENQKLKVQRGRPQKARSDIRKKINSISFTDHELLLLKEAYFNSGSPLPFGVYLRNRLLNQEPPIVSKPMDADIRKQLTEVLKIIGSLTLIAHRTKGDLKITKDLMDIIEVVRGVVNKAHYTVNEIGMVVTIIPRLYPTLLLVQKESSSCLKEEIESILKLIEPLYHRYHQS